MRRFVLWAVPVIALVSCSSGGGSSPVSADRAAGDVATALCKKFSACSPFFVQLQYGDVGACESAAKALVANALAANGSGETPGRAEECAAALATTACDDALGHNLPAACQPVAGHLANGVACGDSSQCQSVYCHKALGSACGGCAAPPMAGATCAVDDDCPVANVCRAGTCTPLAASGASCDSLRRPCKPTLTCKNGTCAAPDAAGTSCSTAVASSGSPDTCDAVAGLYCRGSGTTGTCVKVEVVNPGMPCLLVNNTLTLCAANGSCNLASGGAGSGACLAAAAPGATCKSGKGLLGVALTAPDCAPPAKCQNGVCTVPDPSTCR